MSWRRGGYSESKRELVGTGHGSACHQLHAWASQRLVTSSLKKFWERPACGGARGPIHSWYEDALKAEWRTPQDIKDQYAHASICGSNRVVFNVGGYKYRLVVEAQYQAAIVWVKFVATHAQYDRIDVEKVNDYSAKPKVRAWSLAC